AMVASIEEAMRSGAQEAELRSSGSFLFGDVDAERKEKEKDKPAKSLADVPAWSKKEALDFEKEVMGLYVSSHPLQEFADDLERFSVTTIPDIAGLPAKQDIIVGGMLSRVRPTFVKNGRSAGAKMAMLTLEDAKSNKIDAVCFADTYATCSNALEPDAVVFLEGKVDRRREEPNIIVDRVIPIEQARQKLTRTVKVIVEDAPGLNLNGESKEQLVKLREVFRQASMRANGGGGGVAADVLLELHHHDTVVELRLGGVRVAADDTLIHGVETIMRNLEGRTARCELHGLPKVSRRRAIERHGEVRTEGDLAFAMHDDGGMSIDRLDN
ncbi:MAG: OB-fold nucleic acid binding domain-containing protein, partial [Planctomycetota bacterium]